MNSSTYLGLAVVLVVALVTYFPQKSDGALIDDFLVSAEKATSFFQGADAAKTEAEVTAEAAETAAKTPAEVEREATKSPQELADEVEEAAAELKTEL